jgi:hypothetical protein
MTSSWRKGQGVLAALAAAALVVGCGKKSKDSDDDDGLFGGSHSTGEVEGTVTLPDGKPLPAGFIAFHGKNASQTATAPIDHGKYHVKGAPAGDAIRVTVDISGVAARGQDLWERSQEAQQRAALMKQAGKEDAEFLKRAKELNDQLKRLTDMQKALKGVSIGDAYTKREKTPLKVEVKKGTQTIPIELK